MQHNEKIHGISQGSIIGTIIRKLPESDIHENRHGRNVQPTTIYTGSNKHPGANSIVNGTTTENIQRNIHEILFGQRQNTTRSFPHILIRDKETPIVICYRIPPNLAP